MVSTSAGSRRIFPVDRITQNVCPSTEYVAYCVSLNSYRPARDFKVRAVKESRSGFCPMHSVVMAPAKNTERGSPTRALKMFCEHSMLRR